MVKQKNGSVAETSYNLLLRSVAKVVQIICI